MSDEEFSNENLAKTKDEEELYPVLVAEDGEVLDGKHRVESKPKWHKKTVKAETRLDKIVIRLKAHYRRRIPQSETQALITEAAMELEKTGISKEKVATELVNILPYSERYILLLLPVEYKRVEKVEAGKIGAEIVQQKIQNLAQLAECELCHVHSSDVKPEKVNGKPHNLCPKCLQKANLHHEEVVSQFRFEQQVKEGKVPPKLATPSKPYKETPEFRRAIMTPLHSKMEGQVLEALVAKGVRNIVQDRHFTLIETTPDYYFVQANLAVYLDGGDVHPIDQDETDRDPRLRDMLEKRGVKVKTISYGSTSQKETERVTNQILEWLGCEKK